MSLPIQRLLREHIPENVALAQSVGWPDDEADWRVVHEAGVVLGVRRAGELIGQGVLGVYEPAVGTIAKMIVRPNAQREGIGGNILDALLSEAERRSVTTLGLVATAFGRPLYESRGFEVAGQVAVLVGTPILDAISEPLPSVDAVAALVAFERSLFACSRENVLRGRHREASVTAVSHAPDGAVRGFALATSKGPHAVIGPVVAHTEELARSLCRRIFSAINGAVRIDVPSEQQAFRDWLLGLGLTEKGVRSEMARGGSLPWQVPERFALATQAWG